MQETLSPDEKQLAVFERACRDEGLRITHQRLEVYRELASAVDHPSAETIHQRLRRNIPTISLDTVYRTLSTLARHGLISKIDTVESPSRFEATGIRHHHLMCSECKKISDFQWNTVDEIPLPDGIESWGHIATRNVVVYGVCGNCLEKLENRAKK
jgi:Fur family peroxide stress response transcriptional regulator